jgi:hypothetical protein
LPRLTAGDRIAACSCGALQFFDSPNEAENARKAAEQAEKHCRRSDRPTRDFKWTRTYGWMPKRGTTSAILKGRVMDYDPQDWDDSDLDDNGWDDGPLRVRVLGRREDLERQRTAELQRLARIEAQLAAIESLPPEPVVEPEDDANVIWFVKRFSDGGRPYTYAAVKANDGLWYTTGPRAPKGYTWERLITWIQEGETEPVSVWHAREWNRIAPA